MRSVPMHTYPYREVKRVDIITKMYINVIFYRDLGTYSNIILLISKMQNMYIDLVHIHCTTAVSQCME